MWIITFPEPQLRAPLYYRSAGAGDLQPSAVSTVASWSPHLLALSSPPPAAFGLYYRQPDTSSSALVQAETQPSWRPPITYPWRPTASALYNFQTAAETAGGGGPTAQSTPPPWRPQRLWATPPLTSYLFATSAQDPPPVAGIETASTWRPPITVQPWPLIVQFTSIRGGDVPAAPTPSVTTEASWRPQRLPQPWVQPTRYLFNPATDPAEETSAQFQVFWQYATNYEGLVRRTISLRQQVDSSGPVIVEASTFPSWTGRPLQLSQVPAIAKLLYQNNPAQDLNATPEAPAFPGWQPKPLWPFAAPLGTYLYYRSDRALDVPPPKPTPTAHGRNEILYMRRLELLGVRAGLT